MRKFPGIFITFEGGEKSGKSTQAQILSETLQERGFTTVLTREPGANTAVGTIIREILLDPKYKLSKSTELFLFQADRAQHYKEIIKPNLKAGNIVICDRFLDSTLVYQGYCGGWNLPLLFRLHGAGTGMLIPDVTFIMNGKILDELNTNDTYERRNLKYHEEIRDSYLHLSKNHPRYQVVQADLPKEEVSQIILSAVLELIQRENSRY